MAYLPFYITPEQFQAYQKQRSETIESAPDVTRWMCKNVEHNHRHLRAVIWVVPLVATALIFGSMMTFSSDKPVWYLSNPDIYFLIVPLFIGAWTGYLSYGIDDRYDYTLSSAGLIYKKRLDEPLWGPRFVQIMAYIACGASVLAIAIMGPLALVGSGGFLLLAFACTKKREIDVTEYVIPSDQFLFARYSEKRKVICIYVKDEVCYYTNDDKTLIWRAHTKSRAHLFFQRQEQLHETLRYLKDIRCITCEQVDNLDLLFDFEKSPRLYDELLTPSEEFHRDDAPRKFDDPPPVPESLEEKQKRMEAIFGKG